MTRTTTTPLAAPVAENAERGIIGALAGPDSAAAWRLVEDAGLTAAHFHDDRAALFSKIADFVGRVGVGRLDLLSLGDELRRQGNDDLVGKLHDYVDAFLSIAFLRGHIEAVKTAYAQRRGQAIFADAAAGVAACRPEGVREFLETIGAEIGELAKGTAARVEVQGFSLAEYHAMPIAEEKTLLGNRYLCAEGGLLYVGPSGIGKSSASVQQDACWALGRPAFGIHPARPLKIVCIQAENDAGDMTEITRGVFAGLELSEDDKAALRERTAYIPHKSSCGQAFIPFFRAALKKYRPDIIRLDPLQAYLGADPKDSAAVSMFCRNWINPLLEEYQCACIFNHHTPKTNFRDTRTWDVVAWMYAGAGAADLTNWARAILVVDKLKDEQQVFAFIAAKRGRRIGWADEGGNPAEVRLFRHARQPGVIFWEDAGDMPAPSLRKAVPKKKQDLFALVPEDRPMEQTALLSAAQTAGIGQNRARGFLAELLATRDLFLWTVKRPGTNPLKKIARTAQPAGADNA